MTIDYAAKIKDLYPYANDLARALGVGYPDSNKSDGAQWLLRMRDAFAADMERIMSADCPQDEIEYDSLECGTHYQWLVFTDLQLWDYDADITYSETAAFQTYTRTENVRAIRAEDLRDLAGRLMDEIAGNLGNLLVQDMLAATEDDE